MAIYVPMVMYCLRLFIVVLQELHCLPNVTVFEKMGQLTESNIFQYGR